MRTEDERRCDDDQARRFVQDNGFERYESEHADEKRQSELGTAEANEAGKRGNECSGEKTEREAAVGWDRWGLGVRHELLTWNGAILPDGEIRVGNRRLSVPRFDLWANPIAGDRLLSTGGSPNRLLAIA